MAWYMFLALSHRTAAFRRYTTQRGDTPQSSAVSCIPLPSAAESRVSMKLPVQSSVQSSSDPKLAPSLSLNKAAVIYQRSGSKLAERAILRQVTYLKEERVNGQEAGKYQLPGRVLQGAS